MSELRYLCLCSRSRRAPSSNRTEPGATLNFFKSKSALHASLKTAFALLLASLAASCFAEETPLKLIPYPSSVQIGQGYLALGKDFHATVSRTSDPRLNAALTRALTRLDRQCGGILRSQNDAIAGTATLTLNVAAPGETIQSLSEDE